MIAIHLSLQTAAFAGSPASIYQNRLLNPSWCLEQRCKACLMCVKFLQQIDSMLQLCAVTTASSRAALSALRKVFQILPAALLVYGV